VPRYTAQIRCSGCGLIPARCLCDHLPRVALPFRLLVLQHWKESRKPTNTARLLARVVAGGSIVTVAKPERPWTPELLGPAGETRVVLFPSPGAEVVGREHLEAWSARPTCLVLIDGTWRQAGRIARRAEGVAELPQVALPAGPPSRWPVRRAPRADQLCTFEALVPLVALEPKLAAARALEAAFRQVVAAQRVGAAARA
jgi:DTW domain-containing protein YfiP